MTRFKYRIIVCIVMMVIMIFDGQPDILAATGSVNANETHQTIEGFGASIAFWYGELYEHPGKEEIYEYAFSELGLDFLRLRNIYGKSTRFDIFEEIVDRLYYYSENNPRIMISSWTPPANLKSNNAIGGGTLDTTEAGEYVYGEFAQYWIDALSEYKEIGIEPEYISLQNEPSYDLTYESCVFDPTENAMNAGYDKALDSLYQALQQLPSPPKIIAPEVLGIGYNLFQRYANEFNHDYVDVYAYHLYHGGDGNVNPDEFNTNLITIANNCLNKPIFQTEYDRGDWFNTVWLMHNCLVHGNVSAYFYWTVISTSSDSRAFIILDGSTYSVARVFWAFRQYSKYINSDWKRVSTQVDSDFVRLSAYVSPGGDMLTLVILNVGQVDKDINFNIQGFNIDNGQIIRTSETEQGEEISNEYDGSSSITVPTRSITTVQFVGALTDIDEIIPIKPTDFFLAQNYPNPFNSATRIKYSIPVASFVQFKIYDVSGRVIKTLVNEKILAGKHTVYFVANDLPSGIYFYQIKAGDISSQLHKMVLIK